MIDSSLNKLKRSIKITTSNDFMYIHYDETPDDSQSNDITDACKGKGDC